MRMSNCLVVGGAVLVVALAGCSSDDSGSDATTTTAVPSTSGGSEPTGDVVEVPQVVLSDTDDYAHGTDVSIGQTADAGGVLITVESIAPGTEELNPESGSSTTIDVVATVENSTDVDLAGPDVYTVCADDGRSAIALESSEIASLETVTAGESLSGAYFVDVPGDCTEVLLQARVLSTQGGTDHIAQWRVPPEAMQ
ncbi:MAG: hypothetical protein M5U31_05375 [Acidimicrobiia bacterium]|nr:hypothetical protein [Acidimicrobiia bacterium]